MASPAGQRIVLPSINTILPSWTRDYHPDSGYSSASDDDMPLKVQPPTLPDLGEMLTMAPSASVD
jgi:hypothetical protein